MYNLQRCKIFFLFIIIINTYNRGKNNLNPSAVFIALFFYCFRSTIDNELIPTGDRKQVSDFQLINAQRLQNVLLIWLDPNIDEESVDYRHSIDQLRQVVNDVNIFIDVNQCIDFLTDICIENV